MDVKGRVLDAAPGFEVSRSICREAEEALRAERSRLLDVLIAGSRPGVDVPGDWQESDSAAINEIRDLEFCHRQALHDRLRDLDAALVEQEGEALPAAADAPHRELSPGLSGIVDVAAEPRRIDHVAIIDRPEAPRVRIRLARREAHPYRSSPAAGQRHPDEDQADAVSGDRADRARGARPGCRCERLDGGGAV